MSISLNISVLETYNITCLSVLDISEYPTGYIIQNPYIEITPPGWIKHTSIFTPRSINVYNNVSLGMADIGTIPGPMPDGLYEIRYSIQPNYEVFISKNYFKIDQLKEAFDRGFLTLGLTTCNSNKEEKLRMMLNEAELYIQGVQAAANSCNTKLAQELYMKAEKILKNLQCYVNDL